jgi:hypothetical protein
VTGALDRTSPPGTDGVITSIRRSPRGDDGRTRHDGT